MAGLKILVIEDNPKHYMDAMIFFGNHPEIEVLYASTYAEASEHIDLSLGSIKYRHKNSDEGRVDGVISDIFFPLGGEALIHGLHRQEDPLGVIVMVLCREQGIPCVLNTAGSHHGSKYNWICTLQRALDLPEIVDASRDDTEAEIKNWKRALIQLKEIIAGTYGHAKPGKPR